MTVYPVLNLDGLMEFYGCNRETALTIATSCYSMSGPLSKKEKGYLRARIMKYIPHIAETEMRDLALAVLSTPEVFDKARLVSSPFPYHALFNAVHHSWGLHFTLGGGGNSRASCISQDPEYRKYVICEEKTQPPQIDRVKWVIEHFDVIPFRCMPIGELRKIDQESRRVPKSNIYWYGHGGSYGSR